VGTSRSSGGGKFQGQVVGISRSSGGGKFQGQVVGISRSSGGGNYQGQVVGEIMKVKWWGYQGQLVGEIIKVKWWGYLGQVVGISRPSGGDIKVRGRGLEVKVKKKWWGVRALSNSLYWGRRTGCVPHHPHRRSTCMLHSAFSLFFSHMP
jgi:hypothetical protein